jgi:NodT family efflux transporter outer membrane factor (OMF) lipoprotein
MRSLVITLTVLALAGCSGPPRLRTSPDPVDVPDRFEAAASQAPEVPSRWWEDFGDVGLAEAVAAALEHNQDLRAAAARLDQALAQARIAGADLKPTVGTGASASRNRQSFIGFPVPEDPMSGDPVSDGDQEVVSSTFTNLGTSLNISWEADLWGRLRAASRAAVADAQAMEAEYQAASLSLAGQTTKAWLAAAEIEQQLDLARRTVDSWRAAYEQVNDRYRRGLRSPLDVRLALANLTNAESLVEARLRQLDAALRQLEVLMGRYPGRQLSAPQALPQAPAAIPAGLPAELVGRRPDLVAAERRLAAADERFLVAKRSLYPRLTLTASGGTASEALSDLVDYDFRVWSIAANLLQPVFQGGRLRANVDRARAGTEEAVQSYTAAALRAYAEVETTLAADEHLAGEVDRLSESVRHSRAATKLAEDRYRMGLEDYVTVLDSQRREFTSESAYISAYQRRLENRVDLYLALGGGFRRPDTIPTPAQDVKAVAAHRETRP